MALAEGDLLWTPPPAVIEAANLTRYRRWLARGGRSFGNYPALWHWSVEQPAEFWQSVWDFFGVSASARADVPMVSPMMPGTQWFVGARLNYAQNLVERMPAGEPAIWCKSEDTPLRSLRKDDIVAQTAGLAATLRRLGVRRGDRVGAYLPNVPEALIAFLATTSLGAIWSSCSPDFGARGVLDRFGQIAPKVLFAIDGYVYGGKMHDRRSVVAELQGSLPGLEWTIVLTRADGDSTIASGSAATLEWKEAASAATGPLVFEQVPFDHPLWILYTSGTTGLPKAVVHGHGGMLLEHLKATSFHNDLGPGDRFFWYTSTGWMMWNYLVGGLLSGSSIVLYDGSPGYPDLHALWQFAEDAGVTYFGTSAAFISACMKAGLRPRERFDLTRARALGSTGSPLAVSGFAWVYEHVSTMLALESMSGGTDLCTAFVGGVRTQPIYAGEIQGAALGANVQAFDERGEAVVNEVGELVITTPMPCMPLYFWNDPGMRRYTASYFETFPGVWRHGDWIKFNDRGGCVIYGRSDSTINRHGIRMGTSEIYQAVESLPEIQDSLIVDLELLERPSRLVLFVVLRPGHELNDALVDRLRLVLGLDVSPRHVPDDIAPVPEIPYTLSGKKMEVPVRRILLGMNPGDAANPGAMRNPAALEVFTKMAARPARPG
jgi:acetoacetyl-CoA synthetase